MNRRGQIFHWIVFFILILLLVIFTLKPIRKENFRGEVVADLLSKSKDAELDHIYVEESANLNLNRAIWVLSSRAGFDEQKCGEYKEISVVGEGCLPNYEYNLKEIFLASSGMDISFVSRSPLVGIINAGGIVKNMELPINTINPSEGVDMGGVSREPNLDYSTKYRLTGLRRSKGAVVDRVVLHHTGDRSAEQTYGTLVDRGLSVHYIIDKDGTIYYLLDESLRAAHAFGFNDRSIGIEIVNLGTKSDAFTDEQYRSVERLLRDIAERWPQISYDSQHILGHYQTSKIVCDNKVRYSVRSDAVCGKYDPSPNFDWSRIGLRKHITLADLGLRAPKEAGFA